MKLGFFFSCYKENRAVENSLSELRKHYPDNPIYLVSDGGSDGGAISCGVSAAGG